jgi:hypothetical protein
MTTKAELSADGTSVTVLVPLTFQRRGGRKQVVGPSGSGLPASARLQPASALVKAIARAHRWQRMLESGDFTSIEELAAAARINPSYLARVLRLTLLAPHITEAILNGGHDAEQATLERLMRPFSVLWAEQGRSA